MQTGDTDMNMPVELRIKRLSGGWFRILAVWGLNDVSHYETQNWKATFTRDWKATFKARNWMTVPRIWE